MNKISKIFVAGTVTLGTALGINISNEEESHNEAQAITTQPWYTYSGYTSEGGDFVLDQSFFNGLKAGNMTFNEISNLIVVNEILLQAEIDTKVFIQSVYKTFYKYANNRLLYDKYEENWNYFPCKEWQAFEQCVQQKGLNKRDL